MRFSEMMRWQLVIDFCPNSTDERAFRAELGNQPRTAGVHSHHVGNGCPPFRAVGYCENFEPGATGAVGTGCTGIGGASIAEPGTGGAVAPIGIGITVLGGGSG